MPIKLPLLAALKNVSICYNDGRFSYFHWRVMLSLSKQGMPVIVHISIPNQNS